MTVPVALTIAGSDSGGGAGIQADIKAMQANGVFATSVITAVTAQNTLGVTDAFELPVEIIGNQIDAVLDDFQVLATKTGMLSSSQIIEVVAGRVRDRAVTPLVVDPVMISKSGFSLLQGDAIETLIGELLPLATICTPNAHEAGRLVGGEVRGERDAREAARAIAAMGPKTVVVKGGHLEEEEQAIDILFDGKSFHVFREDRVDSRNTHGTGCTFAASIAAFLAHGLSVHEAVLRAKTYVTRAIRAGLPVGAGHGPTDHFYFLRGGKSFPW